MGCPKNGPACARIMPTWGTCLRQERWLQKGVQLWPNHSGVRRVQRYIVGFYEQPSDASRLSISLDAQISPDESKRDLAKLHRSQGRALPSADCRGSHPSDSRRGRSGQNLARERNHDAGGAWRNQTGHRGRKFRARPSAAIAALFLFTPVTRNMRQDPGFVGLGRSHGSHQILARNGQTARLLHRSGKREANAAPNCWPR